MPLPEVWVAAACWGQVTTAAQAATASSRAAAGSRTRWRSGATSDAGGMGGADYMEIPGSTCLYARSDKIDYVNLANGQVEHNLEGRSSGLHDRGRSSSPLARPRRPDDCIH